MDGAVSNAHDCDSSTDSLVVHDEVQGEIFDEESAVVGQRSSKKGMQHSMTGSVSHCASSVGLF